MQPIAKQLLRFCVYLPPGPTVVKVVPAQNCPRDINDCEVGEGHQDIIVNITNVFLINITNNFVTIHHQHLCHQHHQHFHH